MGRRFITEEIEETSELGCGTIITIVVVIAILSCIAVVVETCSGDDKKEERVTKTTEVATKKDTPEKPTISYVNSSPSKPQDLHPKETKRVEDAPVSPQKMGIQTDEVEPLNDNEQSNISSAQNSYQQYANLYASQEEFNQWYNRGAEILETDIKQRKLLHELSMRMQTETSFNIPKDASDEQLLERGYLRRLRDTPYYESALQSLLPNKRFSREWQKNGSLFSSLDEFYQAYISPDYRQTVRDRKRQKAAE